MSKYETLSYCGIYCGDCKNYKQNLNCAGCRDETELISDCPTRVCAAERGYFHCGECDTFPCEMLNNWYHSGNPQHLQAYHNILEIKKVGIGDGLRS